MEVSAASARGPRRDNEDNFLILLGGRGWRLRSGCLTPVTPPAIAPDWAGDRWLRLAVLDGVGGAAGGRLMAEQATALLAAAPPQDSPKAMREMVRQLHEQLTVRAGGAGISGSTLVLADIDLVSHSATVANVGDSRAWLAHRSNIHPLTYDHRAAEFAYRDGDLGWNEYLRIVGTKTNRLSQALGFGSHLAMARDEKIINPRLRIDLAEDLPDDRASHADAFSIALGEGDALLLGSDGVLSAPNFADWVRELVIDGRPLCAAVHQAATGPGASDNTTAAIVRIRPE